MGTACSDALLDCRLHFHFVLHIQKAISKSFMPWLMVLFCLGSSGSHRLVDGESGLIDRPDVSHYRLTIHLSMAFMLYLALLWTGLISAWSPCLPTSLKTKIGRRFACLGLCHRSVWGLVAGLNAGSIQHLSQNGWSMDTRRPFRPAALVLKHDREPDDGPV